MKRTSSVGFLGKAGVIGTLVSSFSCALCFPAMASIGAAIGLGFLSRWEGLFVHVLLPLFIGIALAANLLGWLVHHQWKRSVLTSIGPVLALLADLGMTHKVLAPTVARPLFYTGLGVMILASLWDVWNPRHRRCAPSVGNARSDC